MPRPKPTTEALAARYESKIDRSGGPDACHPWKGKRRSGKWNYGIMRDGRNNNKDIRVHRFGWEILFGPIPAGLQVCHTCDNPPCNNPRHWFLGTNADNQGDMDTKGRRSNPPTYWGETHPLSKLSDEQVLKIRERFTGKHGEKAALAREFNVSASTITNILSHQGRWK